MTTVQWLYVSISIGSLLFTFAVIFALILKSKLNKLQAQREEDNKEIEQLSENLKSTEMELEAKSLNVDGLSNEIVKSTEECAALQAELSEFKREFAGVKELTERQQETIANLKKALDADSFDGRFPICSSCKDIRDELGFWHPIEEYIQSLSEADFSHSLCPDCAKKLYPDMFEGESKAYTLTWK